MRLQTAVFTLDLPAPLMTMRPMKRTLPVLTQFDVCARHGALRPFKGFPGTLRHAAGLRSGMSWTLLSNHFWGPPREPASAKPFRRRIGITRPAVSRGVPRPPNYGPDQLRGWRQLELGGREAPPNRLLDSSPRLIFRLASRGAARQFRADCGVASGLRAVLQDHTEPHGSNIPPTPPAALESSGRARMIL